MSGVERAMKVRLATLVAAGALLVGLGPAGAERAEAAPNPFFGVMAQMPMTEADFDRMAKGRLGTYRMPIDWGTVDQQEPANMNWEWVDRVVGLTAERGITVLPNFHDTPEWIAPDRRRVPIWNGEVIGRWQAFLRQAVTRYGSNGTFWLDHPDIPRRPIRFWQIWNEPNIRYWAWPVSPARYTKLLRISARTIRNVDPTAKIVLAGLYSRPPDGTGISAGRYLHRLYRQPGFRNSFDVAAIHPYANNTNRSVRRTFPIRRGMKRHKQRGKQNTGTAQGWGADANSSFGQGSLDGQARQLYSAYRQYLILRHRLRLKSVVWFSWEDLPPGSKSCSFCMETGLFDIFGDPKPAWGRLLDLTHAN